MEKQYFYKFAHAFEGYEGFEEEYASFSVCLTEEQRIFLYDKIISHYNNPDDEVSCLCEAIELALDDFYEKYNIQGSTTETPFEWSFDI